MNRKAIDRLQWLFVPVVVVFGWISLKDDWNDILFSLSSIGIARILLALLVVLLGLSCTGLIWSTLLASLGFRVSTIPAQPVFFIGQLGKYIPGSVWAIGAQAKMATKWNIPTRATVTSGILFLYINLFSAILLGLLAATDIWQATEGYEYLRVVAFVMGATFLTPQAVKFFGNKVAGNSINIKLSTRNYLKSLLLMSFTWTFYGSAIFLLGASLDQSSNLTLVYSISSFAAAYAIGLLAIFSPAGVGIREAVLILALAPTIGFEQAAGISLLVRAIHTIADFGLAGSWYIVSKFRL